MKGIKRQPTRGEVIERGEYLGSTEYASGYRAGFRYIGKASEFAKENDGQN